MEIPNTKGVYFMPKIKLEYEEKRFLMQSLVKLAAEMTKEQSKPDINEAEDEFFCTVLDAFDCRIRPSRLFMPSLSVQKVDLKQCLTEHIDYNDYPDEMEHPKEIMEICLEFAYLYYYERKPCNREEFFDKLCSVFDLFPVKRKDYKEILEKIATQVEKHGLESLIMKYKTVVDEKEMAEGYFIINIPEIHIPAYKIEVDMSDKDTLSNWEKITAHLEALGDFVEKPKDKVTCEEISKPIDDLINTIYSQLIDAEEKYTELKDQEDED